MPDDNDKAYDEATLQALARTAFQMVTSFTEAGFSRDEALRLTIGLLSQGAK